MSELQESAVTKDYIVFSLAGELLSIESSVLLEVLEPVPVSPLPLVPSYIDGLVNINGEIIPQINLQVFLQNEFDVTYTAPGSGNSTLLVVTIAGQLIALSVGMIQEPLQLSEQQLDFSSDKECYSAFFSYQQIQVNILSPNCLFEIVKSENKPQGKRSFLGEIDERKENEQALKEYLYIRSEEQVFATLLADVYEVVDVSEIKRQPNSPSTVVGVALIRQTPTLVFSFQALLVERRGGDVNTPESIITDEQKDHLYSLLLIRRDNLYCALLVDEVIGLRLIAEQYINTGEHTWQQVITGSEGVVTAQAIVIEDFFSGDLCEKYRAFMPSLSSDYQLQKVPQQELLQFYIKGDKYTLLLSDVVRIINNKDIHPLLERQAFLTGAIEFDGLAIPVVDMGLQLGYESILDSREYIVVSHNNENWALAIDGVDEIVSVDQPSIDVLGATEKSVQRSVKAYVCVKDMLLSILDVDVICSTNIINLDAG